MSFSQKKSYNIAGTAFVQGDYAIGSKLIEQTFTWKKIEGGISYLRSSSLKGLNTIILHMETNNFKNDNEEEIINSYHKFISCARKNHIPDNYQKVE